MLQEHVGNLNQRAILYSNSPKAEILPPPPRLPGKFWSVATKVMGVSGAGMVMLCVLLHEMHCMSCGSKEREIFCRMFLLLSVRDARNVLLMSGSVSKLPMCGAVVLSVVPVSML